MIRSFMRDLVLTSHFGALLPSTGLATRPTHLVLERTLVPPLHDTGKECGQISYQYEGLVPIG